MKHPKMIAAAIAAASALALAACGGPAAPSASVAPSASSVSTVAQGEEPLVLIVVGFSGDANGQGAVPYHSDYNWHELAFESDLGVGKYYTNQSNGKFSWVPARETSAFEKDDNSCSADTTNDGIVHVTLPRAHGHWFEDAGADFGMGDTSGAYTYDTSSDSSLGNEDFSDCMAQALEAANKYVDFSSYDKNGDGALNKNELGVGIIVAGYEIDGAWMDMLGDEEYLRMQAHANSFAPERSTSRGMVYPEDTVVMAEATTSVPAERIEDSAIDASVMQIGPNSLATLTHELGHYLGLADYYDTTYDDYAAWAYWTPGPLSVMDEGAVIPVVNAEGRIEYRASSLDPFSLIKLGWLEADTVGTSGTYELRSAEAPGGKNALRVDTGNPGEYFLIENRQPTGQDASLESYYEGEAVGGIVVWHVDESEHAANEEMNEVNLPVHHPALTVQYLLAKSELDPSKHTLDFAESPIPDTYSAFWTASNAQERFAELGTDSFELWTYGKGTKADNTKDRSYCGIKLRFPSESADIMAVEIQLP